MISIEHLRRTIANSIEQKKINIDREFVVYFGGVMLFLSEMIIFLSISVNFVLVGILLTMACLKLLEQDFIELDLFMEITFELVKYALIFFLVLLILNPDALSMILYNLVLFLLIKLKKETTEYPDYIKDVLDPNIHIDLYQPY